MTSTMRTTFIALLAAVAAAAPAGAASITAHNVTQGGPHAVAPSIDETSVFVGARDCAYIGRHDIASNAFSALVPQDGTLGCDPEAGVFSMVQGLDGKLYFTLYSDNKIGRVNADGTGLQTIDAGGTHPLDITIGPDGNIWFTINGPPGKVGRVNPATFALVEAPVHVPGDVQGPRGIIAGPDGNLYVPGGESGKLWKVAPSSPPQITEVASGLNGPSYGEVGPDGRIWFTLFEGKGVRTYNPTVGGGQTIPLTGEAWDVSFGEDGKAYATIYSQSKLAQIDRGVAGDTDATVAYLALPGSVDSYPVFIAASPAGNLFAAGRSASALFEIVPDVPPRTHTGLANGVTHDVAAVAAGVNPRASATTVRILYGPTPAFGQATAPTALATNDAEQAVGFNLAGLTPGTVYHYRAEASNRFGTTVGQTRTFTTAQAPDADGDGARPPADCNDADRAIRPGAAEIINDGVDQDCSGADLRLVSASISNQWNVRGSRTYVSTLNVLRLSGAATIEVRCSGGSKRGCSFKKKTRKVTKATSRVSLKSLFRKRALRPKAVVEVRVIQSGFAARVVRYTVRKRKVPSVKRLCLAPGATRAVACAGA